MKLTRYKIKNHKNVNLKIALIADLHHNPYNKIFDILAKEKVDMILLAGDIMDNINNFDDEWNTKGREFLKQISSFGKTFYSSGNHEIAWYVEKGGRSPNYIEQPAKDFLKENDITYLDDEFCEFSDNIFVGGLKSYLCNKEYVVNEQFIKDFDKLNGYKILISHHPELYEKYYKNSQLDLVVSGHAHGGQIRLFGRGLYCPQQGLFPKYTKGVFGNMIITTGAGNNVNFPRLFNRREIVIIETSSDKEK